MMEKILCFFCCGSSDIMKREKRGKKRELKSDGWKGQNLWKIENEIWKSKNEETITQSPILSCFHNDKLRGMINHHQYLWISIFHFQHVCEINSDSFCRLEQWPSLPLSDPLVLHSGQPLMISSTFFLMSFHQYCWYTASNVLSTPKRPPWIPPWISSINHLLNTSDMTSCSWPSSESLCLSLW